MSDEQKWKEIDEARYNEMLGALPPRIMLGYGFLVGEPHGCRFCSVLKVEGVPSYAAFVCMYGKYYEGPTMTLYEFRALTPEALDDIRTQSRIHEEPKRCKGGN